MTRLKTTALAAFAFTSALTAFAVPVHARGINEASDACSYSIAPQFFKFTATFDMLNKDDPMAYRFAAGEIPFRKLFAESMKVVNAANESPSCSEEDRDKVKAVFRKLLIAAGTLTIEMKQY